MTRSRVVFGVLFVMLGLMFLFEEAGVLTVGPLIADWWPAVIIVLGLAQIATEPRNPVGATILVVIGAALLLGTLDVVDTAAVFWPLVLIGLGLWVLFGPKRTVVHTGPAVWGDAVDEVVAFFDDKVVEAPAGPWTGRSVTAMFGDVRLDLRGAQIADGASVQVTTIFGDAEVDVPAGWQLAVSGPEVFGSVRLDPPSTPLGPGAPTLQLRVVAIFGDIRVRRDVRVPPMAAAQEM